MMVDVDTFIEEYKYKNYDELIKIKNKLIKDISEYESSLNKKVDIDTFMMTDPSPDIIYKYNLEYLSKICILIKDKYNNKINENQ